MDVANAQASPRPGSDTEPQSSPINNAITANANGEKLQKPATEASWPDEALNRLLAKLESADTDHFSEVECLEMLFYLTSRSTEARRLAEEAIETYGSLAKVYQRPAQELRNALGLDWPVTSALVFAKLSMKYIIAPQASERREIPSYEALIDYCSLDLRGADQEILRIFYLDKKNRLIREEELARGTIDIVPIYPKEVGRRALLYSASSVILAHNHLSDDPTPSSDDVKATLRIKAILEQQDVDLHDHIIISRSRCFSMYREGLI